MADKKISAMTALTGANVDGANDVMPIIDASGDVDKNKSITPNEFSKFSKDATILDTTNFGKNLSATENSIQKAFDKLDDLTYSFQTFDPYELDVEHRIGKYYNGKPVYRKLISFGSLPNNTTKNVSIGVSNIDTFQMIWGKAVYPATLSTIPLSAPEPSDNSWSIRLSTVGTSDVRITTTQDYSGYVGYILLEYTKSTDTAGATPTFTPYVLMNVDPFSIDVEERTGGYWGGKPIYRKVITCGALLNNTTKSIPHNITNIDWVKSVLGVTKYNNQWFQLPMADPAGDIWEIQLFANTTNIVIPVGTDRTGFTPTYVIIEYTKSTDSSSGTPPYTSHQSIYKTTEIPIGIWEDGRILYRKVINTGALTNASTKSTSHNVTGINKVINIRGYARVTSGGTNIPLPFPHTSPVYCFGDTATIYITTTSDRTNYDESYIIFEYTK